MIDDRDEQPVDLPSLRERLAKGVAEGRFEAEATAAEAAGGDHETERPAWAIIDWDALEAEEARRPPGGDPVASTEPGDLEQVRERDSRAESAMAPVDAVLGGPTLEASPAEAADSPARDDEPATPFKPEVVEPGEDRTHGESTELSLPAEKLWELLQEAAFAAQEARERAARAEGEAVVLRRELERERAERERLTGELSGRSRLRRIWNR